jgi:hypothetical protein
LTEAPVEVLSSAPPEVKRAFENQVNIFSGEYESYVPLDSTITVGQRRVMVAIGAVMAAGSALAGRRKW